MMKRILLLSCLALLAVAGRVQAQTATIDGITYTANDDGQTAAVTYAGRDITEATIPATVNIDGTDYPVTAIGDNAFNSCLDLQIVTLPKGLQSIGYRAFFGCRALQSVTFPEGLQSIGNQAFYYCSALESITLPEGLQTIGREAFYGCNALQSIILPQGLQSIGTATFGSCTALQSITFPEGLQSIDEWAFLSCSALQSVTFPEGLRSIGGNAFTSCPLKDITCHAATPPIIEDYTFNYDTYGTAVLTVPEGAEATYRAAEHWAWFYDSMAENGIVYKVQEDGQGTAAVYAERTITAAHIPATVNIDGTDYPVTAIGDNAFSYCDALQSIDLPEGLQTIGYRAFSYCDALQSVTFPDGLQTIGGVAFFTCTALQSIILPQGLQSIGYNAFSYCDALQSITLPEGLQTIGNQAFYGCSALQSVTLPDGLQSIDLSAFSKCPLLNINSLAAIPPAINNNTFDYSTYGTAVLTVPEGAEATYRAAEHWAWFYDSMAENGIVYKAQEDGQSAAAVYADRTITAAHIPATVNINGTDYPVTAIGDNAFSSCDALQSIDLPEGLQTIGYRAFDGCDALQSVDIPQGVTVIGEDAFSYCSALQSVILPEGLQSIGESAFEDCTSLESITLPEGLQNIDSYAFSRCTSLQSIILPEGLQNIDSYAFSRCTSLQSIILPEGLQAIGWQIFRDCTALESVTLPESLQSIGHGAFYGCPLQDITCLAATPPAIDGSSFDSDTYANAALHVPAGAWAAYQADPYWERLIRYPKIDGVQYYIDFAAQEASVTGADTGITSATIPTTVEHEGTSYPVTAIGNQVFRDNSALQSVTIPEGLKVIGEMAFYGCTALQSIILPESLQTIGWEAFYGCPLQDITCLAATPPAISSNTFDSDTYANATLHVPAEAWATYQADPYWERLIRYPEIGGVQYYIGFATQEASVSGTNESITTANILASVEYDGTEYPVIAIENEAFASCQSLQSVTFPEGLQSIGEEAFYGCTTLQNIDIPQSVTKIGSSTFSGCSALQSVTIPEGVIYIGSSTFSGCRSLTSIDLPSTMQEIGSGAFEDTGLRDVYSRALTPPVINDDTFSQSTYRLATLYVPAEAVENYRSAMGWVLFDHIESDLPPVSITNVATGASLARYANGILTTSGLADITVYAQSGAVVRHAADATSLSLEGLPHGIYIICVAQGRQQQVMKVAR